MLFEGKSVLYGLEGFSFARNVADLKGGAIYFQHFPVSINAEQFSFRDSRFSEN